MTTERVVLPAASGEQERLWFHRFLRATGVVLPVAAGASLGLGLNGGWLEGKSASTNDFKPESPAHFEAAMVGGPSTVDHLALAILGLVELADPRGA